VDDKKQDLSEFPGGGGDLAAGGPAAGWARSFGPPKFQHIEKPYDDVFRPVQQHDSGDVPPEKQDADQREKVEQKQGNG